MNPGMVTPPYMPEDEPMNLNERQLKEMVERLDGMNEMAKQMTDLDWRNLNALLSLPRCREVLNRCPNENYKALGFALLAHRKGKL